MIKKISLPYPIDVLEPYYSKETLLIHFDILYTGLQDGVYWFGFQCLTNWKYSNVKNSKI